MTEQKYTSVTFHSKKWKKTIATGPCLFVSGGVKMYKKRRFEDVDEKTS